MQRERNIEKEYTVEVEFDGKPVPMVPFVQDVIKGVVLGLMRTMHGYTSDTEVKIVVKKER